MLYLFHVSLLLANLVCFSISNSDEKVTQEYKIVNPHPFIFLINPGEIICAKEIFLLVYVHSSPTNYKKRVAIRETWSHMFKDMRVVFMLGDTKNEVVTSLLKYEYSLYNDLIQEDFLDSYRNLTYKGIMSLKWITKYCPNAKYLLKVDDDIIVDIFTFFRHLKKLDEYKLIANKCILCHIWTKMKPMRNLESKWYVSMQEFEADYFGKYCSGSAFLLTQELAKDMYHVSKYIKFFWIDDYYVSGMLMQALNASFFDFNKFYVLRSSTVVDNFKINFSMFGHVSRSINNFYAIWSKIFEAQLEIINKLPKDKQNEINPVIKEFFWSEDVFI